MKKTIALLLCLCLTAALLTGCGSGSIQQYEDGAEPTDVLDAKPDTTDETDADTTDEANTDAPDDAEATEAPTPGPTPDPGLGYAAFEPDTVVATYNGEDISWREYYYWLRYYAEYTQYLAALGMLAFNSWDANDVTTELTNAQVVSRSAADSMWNYRSIAQLAKDEDVWPEDELQGLYEQQADAHGDGDGECTQEEQDSFDEYLSEQFVDRDLCDFMNGVGRAWELLSEKLYGENGSKVTDDEALAFAEEQNAMSCKHILWLTIDTATGEALPEEEQAEKRAEAEDVLAQLRAVEDDPEELEKLFDELMQEHSEDTGLALNPDGYLFTPGVMVAEFENATAALEEYGLSDLVESSYGIHIILRTPIDPDGTLTDSSGSSGPLRNTAATEALAQRVVECENEAEIVWNEDFEDPDIAAIFGDVQSAVVAY